MSSETTNTEPKIYEIQCSRCGEIANRTYKKLPKYMVCPQCKKRVGYDYWKVLR